MAILVDSLNPTWDREIGLDPSVLALTTSNIKLQVVEITVSDVTSRTDDTANSDQVEYDSGYDLNLKTATNFKEIVGIIVIHSRVGHHLRYNSATDKIQQYNGLGAEITTPIDNDNFPIRLLVIGV